MKKLVLLMMMALMSGCVAQPPKIVELKASKIVHLQGTAKLFTHKK